MVLQAVLLAGLLAPADLTETEIYTRATAAKTAEEVAALEPALAKLGPEWRAFRSIDVGMAWMRLRRWDDGLRVLEENRAGSAPEEVVLLDESKVRFLRWAGRDDEAIAAAHRLLDSIAMETKPSGWGPRVVNGLHRELAGIYQRLGRFREALHEHGLWHPDTHCGTCNGEDDAEKTIDIARCRLGLGETDAALEGFLAAATGMWGRGSDGAALYVEHSVRAGRLDAAKARIAKLDADMRPTFDLPLRLMAAWTAKDGKALLDLSATGYDAKTRQPLRWDALRLAARLLPDLGKPGTSLLLERIAAGDLSAAYIAGFGPLPVALPAVKARRAAAPEEDRAILDWAAASIEAARPAR